MNIEILLQTSRAWNGDPYTGYPAGVPAFTVAKITVQPQTTIHWHQHQMPVFGYVLSGQITVEEKETGRTQLLSAGEILAETVNVTHRGFTGSEEAQLIVFYAGAQGMPLSTRAR